MRPPALTALCLTALFALPAAADGYATPRPTTAAPSPLNPHEKQVRIVKIHKESTGHGYTGCPSSCGSYNHSRTYMTEPVVTRRYTRTYTRLAPPACSHSGGYHHPHHYPGYHSSHSYDSARSYSYSTPNQHGHHAYSSGGSTAYHGSSYRAPRYTYSYTQAVPHTDRDKAWAHYDDGWKGKTNSGR